MKTAFMLMAKYGAVAVVPIDNVRRDFFARLPMTALQEKLKNGEIPLPLVRVGKGDQAGWGVATVDLAAYFDWQLEAARKADDPIADIRSARAMNTAFILIAQYDGKAVIPARDVCRDYFAPLTFNNFMQKIYSGEIALPIARMEASQKGAKGVAVLDLAQYLDSRIEAARKECAQLTNVEYGGERIVKRWRI